LPPRPPRASTGHAVSQNAEHEMDDPVQRGLDAWTRGDLDALEAVLDPDVTLGWIEPGDWDCTGREQVMQLLRRRSAEGRTGEPRRLERVDARTVLVVPERPGPYGAAVTRISIAHGKVVAMRQYATRNQALAAE
jgi:ketosteroid isomerase-like protein